jgi:hypothetical protein
MFVSFFAKKFFMVSDKFLFALKGDIQYGRGSNKSANRYSKEKEKSHSINTAVKPTFIFFPSSRWGIEAGIGSLGYFYKHGLASDYNDKGFSANFGSISLGLNYYFRK